VITAEAFEFEFYETPSLHTDDDDEDDLNVSLPFNKAQFMRIINIPHIFRNRYGNFPDKIMIRMSYSKLYDIVTLNMINDDGQLPATLFTGVPGIGKSLFLLYFIMRFLTDDRFRDKRFALEFTTGVYYYVEMTEIIKNIKREPDSGVIVKCYVNWSIRSATTCPTLEIPIFCDINKVEGPFGRGRWLFIFSSPYPARYKEMLKNCPSYKYILPTWSYEELLTFNSEDNRWVDRFILFGGVPKSIFWSGEEDVPLKTLREAIEAKGGIIAEYFFHHRFGYNIDDDKSYYIVHSNPPWSPEKND
jgi:hypothetical protein